MKKFTFYIFGTKLIVTQGTRKEIEAKLVRWPQERKERCLNHELVSYLNDTDTRGFWLDDTKDVDQQVISVTTKFLENIDKEAIQRCGTVPEDHIAMNKKDEIIKSLLQNLHMLLNSKYEYSLRLI